MSKFLDRSLQKARKLSEFYLQKDAYTGTNIKNIQLRVRLFNDNPSGPTELILAVKSGTPVEAAIVEYLEGLIADQTADHDAQLAELGFEHDGRAVRMKALK